MAALALAATFLVGGYEFARSSSTSLFISAYGSSMFPYAMTAVPFVMALLIYAYGRALSRWGAMRTLMASSGISLLVFVACFLALKSGFRVASAVLYVYCEVYIVLLVEQYWSLINSTLKPEEARLFNGPIIACASLGPITAGQFINRFAGSIGTETLVLLAAAALIPAAALSRLAFNLAGEPQPSPSEKGGHQGHLHLRLFIEKRPLLLLAFIVAASQIVSTALSLRFFGLLETSFPVKDVRTAYLGGFWSAVNGVGLALQLLAVPALLRFLPLRWVHLGIPIVHVTTCYLLMANPSLETATTAFLLYKSLDYSLFRASKELLYIPLSYDARYRAKQIIDSFTYRCSKGVTAGAFSLATVVTNAIPAVVYPVSAMLAALTWAGLVFPLTAPVKPAADGSGSQ